MAASASSPASRAAAAAGGDEMPTVSFGVVPEHYSIPFHRAAKAAAADAAADAKLRVVEMPRGTGSMTAAVRAGELDCAVALTEGLLADRVQRGAGFQLVAPYARSALAWGIAVAAGSPLASSDSAGGATDSAGTGVAGLRGKRFGVSRLGSGSHLMALLLARREGWDKPTTGTTGTGTGTGTDEESGMPTFVVVGGVGQLAAALADGTCDAFLWETSMLRAEGVRERVAQLGTITTPWPCFCVAVRDSVLADPVRRRAVAAALLRVRAEARAFLADRTAALAEVTATCALEEADARVWLASIEFADDEGAAALADTAELRGILDDCRRIIADTGILDDKQRTEPPTADVITSIGGEQ